jgi:predicted restriction endonuclease
MKRLNVDEIIEVFLFYKPELKMQEIKENVLKKRNGSYEGYKHLESFNQTIQDIVQSYCEEGDGYRNISIFEKVSRGNYRLKNHEGMLVTWREAAQDIDQEIEKLNKNLFEEDLELIARTIREVNVINRQQSLVAALKDLYGHTCQLCSTKLQIEEEKFYSEVHHIQPLGQPHNGPDNSKNMIVVCPNCHVLLDFRAIEIKNGALKILAPHVVDDVYLDFHNSLYHGK